MPAPKEIQALVDRFTQHRESYKGAGYKEAQLRQEFLDPMLKALGWDVDNDAGYAEVYKDVIHEDALKIDGGTKAPDYCMRIGGTRKFFVEAKKPSVDIKQEAHPAYQLRRYAWSAKLPLSVLTDFEEFAVYDCRIRPDQGDKASTARILYLTFQDYVEKWDQIASVFSRESILKGSFDKFAEKAKLKRGTAEVDDAFLQEIETWRSSLAEDIFRHNQKLTQRELNTAVQRIIDRIVFLRICEDRGIETYATLRRAIESQNAYTNLLGLFTKADARYNSGLFYFKKESDRLDGFDQLTPLLVVGDDVLKRTISSLYYPQSPYEFSVLSTEILGQVYEQFLGKIIAINGKVASVVYKPDVKKKGGVYYTPTFVVDYIVRATAGAMVENKTPAQVAKLRFVDPACGSGSFLLGLYGFLLDWHRRYYIATDPTKHSKGKLPRLHQSHKTGGGWKLTAAEKKRILLANIYGVDIDAQAVEVTKLSLLLKVLEEESSETVAAQLKLFHERALPDLGKNIRCGNSLIGTDFLSREESRGLSDEDIARINPFDYEREFPGVFAGVAPGFDAVVGNPPYAYRKATEQDLREYYATTYSTAEGNFELYKFFVERAVSLLRKGGALGFIVSATFLVQPSFEKLRRLLVTRTTLEKLAPLGPSVFKDATVDTAIFIAANSVPPKNHMVSVVAPLEHRLLATTPPYEIRQSRFEQNPAAMIDYRLTEDGAKLVNRLVQNLPPMETFCEFGVGINTGFIRDELVSDRKLDSRYHPMVPGTGISRYGAVNTTGWIMYDASFVRSKGKRGRTLPEERFLSADKILVVRTRNLSLRRRIVATVDRSGSYNLNRLSNIVPRSNVSVSAILAILNSELFQWLFATRYFDYEIKPVYLRASPVPKEIPATLTSLSDSMLDLVSKIASARADAQRELFERRRDALDIRIDNEVYQAYGVSAEERALIRKQLQLFAPVAMAEGDSEESAGDGDEPDVE